MVMGKIDTSGLTEAQATLLMPLWARALESRRERPILRDTKAEEIVKSLDFDFDLFRKKAVPVADYCLRAAVIDQLVRQFLERNEPATVVELGVGLDTRSERLDNGKTTWVEFDLRNAMDVRKNFFESTPRRVMISGSLLESNWVEQVVPHCKGPTLFVAEGVLYFFKQKQVQEILAQLVEHFPNSGLIFDAQSPWFLKLSNLRHPFGDSHLDFSLASVKNIETWDERLRVHKYVGFGDSPYYDAAMPRLSQLRRWGRYLFPPVRHLFKIVHVVW